MIAGAGERVSTPEAYSRLDREYNDFANYSAEKNAAILEALISDLKENKSIDKHLFNIFEDSVLDKCPRSKKLKDDILSLGAEAAMMSGSGPSVFGIFKNEDDAKRAKEKLLELGYRAYCAKSV